MNAADTLCIRVAVAEPTRPCSRAHCAAVGTYSGNPDLDGDGRSAGPWEPGHSDACIIGDMAGSEPGSGQGTSSEPYWAAHGVPHSETNSLWGDGHVESNRVLEHYAIRWGTSHDLW